MLLVFVSASFLVISVSIVYDSLTRTTISYIKPSICASDVTAKDNG